MLPNDDWVNVPLGAFTTLQRGHDLPEHQRRAGSIPVMGSFGITGWHDEAKTKGPGVTVGRSGASFGVVNYSDVDYWPLNTALYVLDFHGNDERFAYYLLSQFDFKRFNSGSAQPSLNRNFVHPAIVRVPPIAEQRAIARLLGALDDKVELNRRMNETLEDLAVAIVANIGANAVPISTVAMLHRQTVDPTVDPARTFELFSLPAYDAGRMPQRAAGASIKSSKLAVPTDAVLLSKLNPHIPRRWVPDADGLDSPVASTEWLVLRPAGPWRHVLYARLGTRQFRDELAGRVTGTTGSHQRVRADDVLSLELPWGPSTEQAEVLIEPLLRLAAANRRESQTLAKLRDALLPELISGRMRVKDAEKLTEVPT